MSYTSNGNAASVVDNLALLLTAGRLNTNARNSIISSYNDAGGGSDGLKIAQKLIAATPEYHSTNNIVDTKSIARPAPPDPTPSTKPYKAVVFLMFDGGADSHNMLVPHSECTGKGKRYIL